MARVVVVYATKYGSTTGVAEAIGKRLSAAGADADVRHAKDVKSLDGVDAVVLAVPLYIGSMLKDARVFLDRHQQALSQLQVAIALMGPTSAADDIEEAKQQIEPLLAKTPWFKPVAVEMFVGAYDPDKLRGADKLVTLMPTPLKGKPASDGRDWAAIDAWADTLPGIFGPRSI